MEWSGNDAWRLIFFHPWQRPPRPGRFRSDRQRSWGKYRSLSQDQVPNRIDRVLTKLPGSKFSGRVGQGQPPPSPRPSTRGLSATWSTPCTVSISCCSADLLSSPEQKKKSTSPRTPGCISFGLERFNMSRTPPRPSPRLKICFRLIIVWSLSDHRRSERNPLNIFSYRIKRYSKSCETQRISYSISGVVSIIFMNPVRNLSSVHKAICLFISSSISENFRHHIPLGQDRSRNPQTREKLVESSSRITGHDLSSNHT